MKKSYHEHCVEERTEALQALRKAKNQIQKNIPIIFLTSVNRKIIFSVPPNRVRQMVNKLKRRDGKILTINGKPYNTVKDGKEKYRQ